MMRPSIYDQEIFLTGSITVRVLRKQSRTPVAGTSVTFQACGFR